MFSVGRVSPSQAHKKYKKNFFTNLKVQHMSFSVISYMWWDGHFKANIHISCFLPFLWYLQQVQLTAIRWIDSRNCISTRSGQFFVVVQGQEAKYVEKWPSTISAWAGWSRFDIPVDRYPGVHSLLQWPSRTLGSSTYHKASQQGNTYWAKYQKADRAVTLCTLWFRVMNKSHVLYCNLFESIRKAKMQNKQPQSNQRMHSANIGWGIGTHSIHILYRAGEYVLYTEALYRPGQEVYIQFGRTGHT
jgi:hypothetical protein